MEITMNREKFQRIAEIRMEEATALYEQGFYQGAYYLSGYVIECALKACIAKKMKQYDFPPNAKVVQNIYTHNLETLLKNTPLSEEMKNNDEIALSWATIKDWNEGVRYKEIDETIAKESYEAVVDPERGVFNWIKQYW